MSFSGLLNSEMNVLSASMSPTAYGGQSPALSTVYSARPCRIVQMGMNERDVLGRLGVEATHKIFCEADITVLGSHQVVISGLTYQVTGYDPADGAVSVHHNEIVVKRLSRV